ncbi:MAG: sigma-54 dependent transcriptional regulator [Polyangiales bacterium]
MESGTRILVVDDDVGLATFMAEVLHDAGHETVQVHGVEAARREVETGSFDLVLTDLRMPGGSGMDLIAWLRGYDPRIAVVAVTAYGSVETAVQAIRLGATDYIPKPFEPRALLLAVDKALRERGLRREIERLRGAVEARFGFESVIARSQVMQEIVAFARRIADSPSTVLLTGPSGAGKEVIARAIHQASQRRDRPFVGVNCAAIPDTLLESELFGHKRGAFTGATADRRGLFAEAQDGTLLLDEVGDLPLGLQVKLLRALQDREIRPVGATRAEPFNVRLIAATHVDLKRAIQERAFREDLYYRLCVLEITIPPLADRADDILPLAEHFLRATNARLGRAVRGFSGAAAKMLCQHRWPGNVRELENAVERAVNVCASDLITPDDLPAPLHRPAEEDVLDRALDRQMTLDELNLAYARRVLVRVGGNKKRAAALLGIDRRTLHRWFGGRDDDESRGE